MVGTRWGPKIIDLEAGTQTAAPMSESDPSDTDAIFGLSRRRCKFSGG